MARSVLLCGTLLCSALCLLDLVDGARISLTGELGERPVPPPPSQAVQEKEFYQCTRQCRWSFGFFNLQVVGGRKGWSKCQCYRLNNSSLGYEVLLPAISRYSDKDFDTNNTWSGNSTSGFSSDYVCVQTSGGIVSMSKEEAVQATAEGGKALHCGRCAACSAPADIEVMSKTRKWITEVLTALSARFAAPWGHHDPVRLARELTEAGIAFSRSRYDGRTDLPSCMDVWVDNIMCDAMSCKQKCWIKFFDPKNAKTEITGDIHWYDFNAKCLRCDETNCGPAFVKGAGANRRSSGIESDIKRPEAQKCQMGMYSGVPDADLPTLPKPCV
ncbi:unnamed protein product [Effrenium voratum]|nr:unnamed protein product [Effrenium voratum]